MTSLDEYRRKRRFNTTPEPSGRNRRGGKRKASREPRFVIQKHDASSLHYDFRLETGGVLKSWAVPKGPSTDPRDKRLAVMTEDHPLDYADFEGVIPEGEYGAGTVMIWDEGAYENRTRDKGDTPIDLVEGLKNGHVTVVLKGQKLAGAYALTRTRWHSASDWLLVKVNDEEADARRNPVSTQPDSVKTGRSLATIAAESAPGKTLTAGKRRITVLHPDKLFFPDDGITKGDLVDYYARIAPRMLPYTEGRFLVMHRFPDGIGGKGFFHKSVPDHFPDWIPRHAVDKKEGGSLTMLIADEAATLVYLAEQGCITPHVWLSPAVAPHRPDRLVFDLDPPEAGASDAGFAMVRRAAKALVALCDALDVVPFTMTTGSRGLHLLIPLDGTADFEDARALARAMADVLVRREPEGYTTAARKAQRGKRLYLDVTRNAYAQTTVSPYAVRAKPGAPVATPLALDELNDSKLNAQRYHRGNIFRRLGHIEDPWRGWRRHAVNVAAVHDRLKALVQDESR